MEVIKGTAFQGKPGIAMLLFTVISECTQDSSWGLKVSSENCQGIIFYGLTISTQKNRSRNDPAWFFLDKINTTQHVCDGRFNKSFASANFHVQCTHHIH